MMSINDLEKQLRRITEKSSLRFADLAAGDESGVRVRMEYTAPSIGQADRRQVTHAESLADRRYLIASITKPIVAMMAVQLAADGELSLNQHVRDFVDGFHRGPLRAVTIRHLLTHSSGLPDMLPHNNELRAQHASLAEFVQHTTAVTPQFAPGTECGYSSMGFAVLAVIIEQLTGSSLPEVLSQRLFQPLSMNSSWLGIPVAHSAQLMPTVLPCELPPWQSPDSDWNWNSLYWRTLGAPWGGMMSTAEDLGRLAVAMLNSGVATTGHHVLRESTVRSCTRNQTRHMPSLSEKDRIHHSWGLGWRLNWLDHSSCFSDFLPRSAFGHWGATGTMMWIEAGIASPSP